jgi:hypothetical protein
VSSPQLKQNTQKLCNKSQTAIDANRQNKQTTTPTTKINDPNKHLVRIDNKSMLHTGDGGLVGLNFNHNKFMPDRLYRHSQFTNMSGTYLYLMSPVVGGRSIILCCVGLRYSDGGEWWVAYDGLFRIYDPTLICLND